MNLSPYVENVQRQLVAAAGGGEARALADQLAPALESAVRLALQDALAAAVGEITLELAPGSVELRLRGRDPEFVLSLPPDDAPPGPHGDPGVPIDATEAKQGAMSRINLRMPEQLRLRVETAAASAGLSVNAWLVRAAAAAVGDTGPRRHERATTHGSQRYTGWAR
jgi:hypothetical protein